MNEKRRKKKPCTIVSLSCLIIMKYAHVLIRVAVSFMMDPSVRITRFQIKLQFENGTGTARKKPARIHCEARKRKELESTFHF